jgi:hypothetical protein
MRFYLINLCKPFLFTVINKIYVSLSRIPGYDTTVDLGVWASQEGYYLAR